MGLIKAATGAAGGVLADQWKEYFYCESMPADVLITKAHKKCPEDHPTNMAQRILFQMDL